jgi:3',5'-cyclic AMP phosphodiesterase CpdA
MLGRSRNTKERYFHDALLEGIHIVMLDTSEPGKVGGSIGPEQFEWLEATLKSHGHAPKLIGIHHPPSVENNPRMEWESITWKDSVRLAELIAPYNVAGIMCGHLHSDRVTNWHGIPVVMSTGPHLALDPLLSRHVGIRMLEGTSFGLCTIRPSGLEVNFVPLPASRNELHRYDFAQMKWAQSRAEAAAAE